MDERDVLACAKVAIVWGIILLGVGFYALGHGWWK